MAGAQVYGVLPAATMFMVYYSKISTIFDKKALFYVTAAPFMVRPAPHDAKPLGPRPRPRPLTPGDATGVLCAVRVGTLPQPRDYPLPDPGRSRRALQVKPRPGATGCEPDRAPAPARGPAPVCAAPPVRLALLLRPVAEAGAAVRRYGVALLCNWSYSLFYIVSELWGSVGVSVLFWQLANDIIPVWQAQRFYPLFGQLANIAPICAGQTVAYFAKVWPAPRPCPISTG